MYVFDKVAGKICLMLHICQLCKGKIFCLTESYKLWFLNSLNELGETRHDFNIQIFVFPEIEIIGGLKVEKIDASDCGNYCQKLLN